MARPKIDRLFDHVVIVWRPTADANNRLGVEQRAYSPAYQGVGCAVNRNESRMADTGPGMDPVGQRRMYFRPDADVRARDVIQIVEGPDSPGTWEVDQPPTRPRGHHTQVDGIAWNGILPVLATS